MQKRLLFILLLGFLKNAAAITLPAGELAEIGQKIYQNECASKPENLLHWNANESFASLGIGHFIWFSKSTNQIDLRFEEQFPELVRFIDQQQRLPADLVWLKGAAPWQSKQTFVDFKNHADSLKLKQWLIQTQGLQAQFIWQRFLDRLARLKQQNALKSPKVSVILQQMLQNSKTRFALVDYVNFKGWGDNPKERYRNQGWGLLQVLRQTAQTIEHANGGEKFSEHTFLNAFVTSAKQVLNQRIENAPASKNETKWRNGWFARLDQYKNTD